MSVRYSPIRVSVSSLISAPDGLCRLVRQMRRVFDVICRAMSSAIELKLLLGAAFEAENIRPQIRRHFEHRSIGWLLDQHLVARFQQRRHSQMIRHRSAGGGDNAIRCDAALAGQTLLAAACNHTRPDR